MIITEEHINSIIAERVFLEPEFEAGERKTIICVMKLRNGFEVVGKSGVVDPSKFDEVIGRKFAMGDAINQIWALEGYLAQQRQFEHALPKKVVVVDTEG